MARGDDYLTADDLKSYMELQDDTKGAQLADAVASASREIERHCNRQFNDAGSATARRYVATNSYTLAVDDFSTEAGFVLEVDSAGDGTWTEVPSTDYQLSPLDGLRDGLP